MLKKTTLLLMLISIQSLQAKQVTLNQAKNVATNWMFEKTHQEYSIKKVLKTTESYKIFELAPKGWIIISGDDVANPVIGYGITPIGTKINPNIKGWLSVVNEEISKAAKHMAMASNSVGKKTIENLISKRWKLYEVDHTSFKQTHSSKSNRSTKISRSQYDDNYVVKPLLWLHGDYDSGIKWNQEYPYNRLTPVIDSSHTYTGCVATAMGQIMRYYRYPNRGTGSLQYYSNSTVGYVNSSFNHTYNWDKMSPVMSESDGDDIPRLLFDAGVAVEMDYEPEYSAAYTYKMVDALKTYFKYEVANYYTEYGNSTKEEIYKILKSELNSKRPVYYAGGGGNGRHAFVVDGYDKDEYYHVNWGWGGDYNGKFLLSDLTPVTGYDFSNDITIAAISPHKPSNIIHIYDQGLKECVMEKLSISNENQITKSRVNGIKNLECLERDIVDISSLINFENLEDLHLDKNNISDISPLEKLTNLTILSIYMNKIEDISSLKNLTSLEHLDLYDNLIVDISALKNMNALTYLDIGKNYIRDFSPIDHLDDSVVEHKYDQHGRSEIIKISDHNLERCVMSALDVDEADEIIRPRVEKIRQLNCRDREISDISSLAKFKNLRDLDLDHNNISDLSGLKNLNKLRYLRLYSCNISDLSPLKNLTDMVYLDIWNNEVRSLEPLRNFNSLNYLDIGQNYITDFSPIDHLDDSVVDHKYDQKNATLNAPSNLKFTDITKHSVTLHWRDNSNNESGFKIFRDGDLIHKTKSNVTSYKDENLKAGTRYKYTIKATTE